MNSPISMLKPPSPMSAITWRERSSACTPLACASAVPTAALLNEPMMRCDPVCRIQFANPARYRLRMDTILAALEISLLGEHFIPLPPFVGDLVPEFGVGLRRDF